MATRNSGQQLPLPRTGGAGEGEGGVPGAPATLTPTLSLCIGRGGSGPDAFIGLLGQDTPTCSRALPGRESSASRISLIPRACPVHRKVADSQWRVIADVRSGAKSDRHSVLGQADGCHVDFFETSSQGPRRRSAPRAPREQRRPPRPSGHIPAKSSGALAPYPSRSGPILRGSAQEDDTASRPRKECPCVGVCDKFVAALSSILAPQPPVRPSRRPPKRRGLLSANGFEAAAWNVI